MHNPPTNLTPSEKPVRLYFLGLRNGRWPTLRRSSIRHLYKLEERAPGECEALSQMTRLRRTNLRKKAEIVFSRNDPDVTTDKEYAKLKKIADKLPNHVLQINPIHAFHNHDNKINGFKRWTQAGIPCPEFMVLPEAINFDERCQVVYQFIRHHNAILLRTNNEGRGYGLYSLDNMTPERQIAQTLKQLDERVKQRKLTRKDSHIIAVKVLQKDTPLAEARIFVIGNQLLDDCGHARIVPTHVQQLSLSEQAKYHDFKNDFSVGNISKEDFKLLHEANYQLKQRLKQDRQLRQQCLKAVHVLGNNFAAIDLLFCNDKPVFLEINPNFGGEPCVMGRDRAEFKDIWNVRTSQEFYEQIYTAILEAYWAR